MFAVLTGPGYDADGDLTWDVKADDTSGWYPEEWPDFDWTADDWASHMVRIIPVHLFESIEQREDSPW